VCRGATAGGAACRAAALLQQHRPVRWGRVRVCHNASGADASTTRSWPHEPVHVRGPPLLHPQLDCMFAACQVSAPGSTFANLNLPRCCCCCAISAAACRRAGLAAQPAGSAGWRANGPSAGAAHSAVVRQPCAAVCLLRAAVCRCAEGVGVLWACCNSTCLSSCLCLVGAHQLHSFLVAACLWGKY
jgi:hypothetical protein